MFVTSTRKSILAAIRTIDKAIVIAHNAIMFYSDLSMRTESKELARIFRWLAAYERLHRAELTEKRKEFAAHPLVKGRVPVTEFDPSLTKISLKIDPTALNMKINIMRLAVANARKAFAFYQRKSTYTTDPTVKALLKEFADIEEKRMRFFKAQLINVQSGHSLDEIPQSTSLASIVP